MQRCRWWLEEVVALNAGGPEVWRRPVSTTRAAGEFGVSDDTVRRWIRSGRLPGRRLGRNWQIPRAVLGMLDRCSQCGECEG